MSVKFALLALLAHEPSTTYQLRKSFDTTTSSSWPLNIGQVSTTLQRLQRDGLVARDEPEDDDADTQGRWHLTEPGRVELAAWWATPIVPVQRGRDELVIKLALAVALGDVDVVELVRLQRTATQRALHDVTRLRRGLAAGDVAGRLILDNHLFLTEAELRWLDDVDETLARSGGAPRPAPADVSGPAAGSAAGVRPSERSGR